MRGVASILAAVARAAGGRSLFRNGTSRGRSRPPLRHGRLLRLPRRCWAACCVEHDIPYWCGGTRAARAEADETLRACVAARRSPALAFAMKLGVRLGGHPWWPTYWRFGYGRDWPSGYVE